jgi:lipopolysaccharide/colanic/teichoic acid biosynthesis glycosyltransferase
MIYKTLHIKLKIERHELLRKPGITFIWQVHNKRIGNPNNFKVNNGM